MRGFFITFEGIEGSGKSTQARALFDSLKREGIPVIMTREPGGTDSGEKIRELIIDPSSDISPLAEFLLFAASRAEHADKLIRPHLEEGYVVICDRFTDSSLAYQGFGRGVPVGFIRDVNAAAAWQLSPDITFCLELTPEESAERVRARTLETSEDPDRLEMEKADFFRRAFDGYRHMAAEEPARFRLIDGTGDRDRIAARIKAEVMRELSKRGLLKSEKGYIGIG